MRRGGNHVTISYIYRFCSGRFGCDGSDHRAVRRASNCRTAGTAGTAGTAVNSTVTATSTRVMTRTPQPTRTPRPRRYRKRPAPLSQRMLSLTLSRLGKRQSKRQAGSRSVVCAGSERSVRVSAQGRGSAHNRDGRSWYEYNAGLAGFAIVEIDRDDDGRVLANDLARFAVNNGCGPLRCRWRRHKGVHDEAADR